MMEITKYEYFLHVHIAIALTRIAYNCQRVSVANASDTQEVGHGFEPRPDH